MVGATSRVFRRCIMRSTSSRMISSASTAVALRPSMFGLNRFVQIVDVVEEDVVELVDVRLDVARHGDVDQKHRPVACGGR